MSSVLKDLWVKLPSEKRRYLLIVFFVFVAIGVVEVATYLFSLNLDTQWEKTFESRSREIVEGVLTAFADVQSETYSFARNVAENPALVKLVEGENLHDAGIFLLLEQLNRGEEYSSELYDSHLSLLAWAGKQAEVDSSDVRRAVSGRALSVVSQSALYTFLTVITPVRDAGGKTLGAVAVSRAVEVNYPLNNRFLTSSGLQKELSRKFATGIHFQFGEGAEPSRDGRVVSADIQSLDGRKLGVVDVEQPARSSYALSYLNFSNTVVSTLGALIPFIIIAGYWKDLRRLGLLPQVSLFLLLVWATRYLWLALDFPSILFHDGIFDPSYFASPFGFGLTKSIGELLISSLFLFGSITYALTGFFHLPPVHKKTPSMAAAGLTIAVTLVLGGILALLTRGFVEAIRSAVFDSTLKYTDPTTIVPSPQAATMLFGILLLTASCLFLGAMIFLLSVRLSESFLASTRRARIPSWLIVIVIFVAGSIVFGLLHPNPQTSVGYRFVFVGLVALFAFLLQHEAGSFGRPFTGRSFAGAMVLSIIIATPILDLKIHERDRDALRLYAIELARPVDNWVRLTLQETLGQMISDEETVHALTTQDRDILSGAAFRLWAKSGLSREGFNCAVGIVQSGKIESLFHLGLQRSEATSLIADVADFRETKIFLVRSGREVRGLDRYVGIAPINSPDGVPLANLVIIVVSGQSMLLRTETPEILQTPSALNLETQFRNLIVSEYAERRLVRSTGDDLVRGHEVPDDAYTALVSGKAAFVWTEESLDGKGYESLYTLLRTEASGPRILALRMQTLDIRWHVFNLLKVIFLYLFVASVIALLYFFIVAIRKRKFRLSFRAKLLAALLSLATIPLLLLSYYDRKFTEESRLEILRHQVEDELKVVASNLLNHLVTRPQGTIASSLTDSLCARIALETGSDFNVYVGNEVLASSRPELYDAELIDTRLNSSAYRSTVLEGRKFYLQTEAIGMYPFLVGYERLDGTQGQERAVISVFTAFKHLAVDQELFKRSAFIFGTYAVIMILIVLVGVFFAFSIASPIKKLTEGIRRVSGGDLDLSLEVRSRDELGELVAAFNKMTQDLKRIQKELTSAERELAWREMAKQVAHEIKNPLTPMKLSIQHLRQAYTDRVKDFNILLEEVSKTIIDQVDALSRIAAEFSRYARMPERKYEPCDVHALLNDAVKLFDQETNVDFVVRLAKVHPMIMADKEELRRVFINILRNAVQAIPEKGEVRVTTSVSDGLLEIVVADTGRGIPEELIGRLFEPNFSTKSEGMGLGLAISKQTIVDLNGRIEIESKVGKGTRVKIFLPVTLAS